MLQFRMGLLMRRLLRLRTLIALTLALIMLYMIKSFTQVPNISGVSYALLGSKQSHGYFVPTSLKKIDWHDYEQIKYEKQLTGIGQQGKPAYLPKEKKDIEEQLYSVNGYNGALSDVIPVDRALPDIRHEGCKSRLYIESLPTVSVVVPFHNEHASTLIRTAHSVIHRSPKGLIKEVFLVDDASTKESLKKRFEEQLHRTVPSVKLVRLQERSGLIAARLAGARRATADVLIFLDSHTEAGPNWLPPLLEPIALNPRTVVCPYIDVIAHDTFEYRAQDEGARGAFDWELYYKRLPLLPRDEANMPEPFESPIMAGGLFAISRPFFWELGGYDPGLDIWGGEQYELSFKVWQCGGRMLDAPCSRVGHIYRKFAPFPNPGHGDFVGKNYRRVAEVWMDEYAQYLYKRRPHYLSIPTGDISKQKALRERLHCKPFKWFITQVAFDLVHKYPPVEPEPFAEGRIRPATHPQLCVDAHRGAENDKLQLKACTEASSAEQRFALSWHKDIRSKERNMCWDLPNSAARSPILLYGCHLSGGNQLWRYHPKTQEIRPGDSNNCVEWEKHTRALYVNPCDGGAAQRWTLDTVNEKMLAKWDSFAVRVTGPLEY